jgi:ribonucleoside-diphosphate reductase alpha chain
MIVDGAWKNGEPGLFMIDQSNREHSFDTRTHKDHVIEATNPCGEQPLENLEACNLGHINLSLMVRQDIPSWNEFAEKQQETADHMASAYLDLVLDQRRLNRVINTAMRFLDNAVTMSRFPIEEIDAKAKHLRKVGLGIMGYAQLLAQMGIAYGSKASFAIAAALMQHINRRSKLASHRLARERGVFEDWEASKYANPTQHSDWFRKHTGLDPLDWPNGFPVRNHSTTTVAPTGTTSMIANTSAGCEPLFNVVYFKRVSKDVHSKGWLTEFDDYFLKVLGENDLDVEGIKEEALRLMDAGEFVSARNLSVPRPVADIFVTAVEVSPGAHVLMQATFQEHVDSAISKTINFSPGASRREIADAFRQAWSSECKGITVYRIDSREQQVLGIHKDGESWEEECHCGKH